MLRAGTSRTPPQTQVAIPLLMQPGPLVQVIHTSRPAPPTLRTRVLENPETFPRMVVLGDTFSRTTTVETVCPPGCVCTTTVTVGDVHYPPMATRRHYAPSATIGERRQFALSKANGNAAAAECLLTWHALVENVTGVPIGTLEYPTVSIVVDVARAARLTREKDGHVTVELYQGVQKKTAQAASDSAADVLSAVAGLVAGISSVAGLNAHFSLQGCVYPVNGPPRAVNKRNRGDEQPGLLRGKPTADITLYRNPPCCKCNEPTRLARAFKTNPKDETRLVMCPACARDPEGIAGHITNPLESG